MTKKKAKTPEAAVTEVTPEVTKVVPDLKAMAEATKKIRAAKKEKKVKEPKPEKEAKPLVYVRAQAFIDALRAYPKGEVAALVAKKSAEFYAERRGGAVNEPEARRYFDSRLDVLLLLELVGVVDGKIRLIK